MITQVEVDVQENGRFKCYWLTTEHRDGEFVTLGMHVILAEEGVLTPLLIRQTFATLPDGCPLPPQARVGTVLELLPN